MTIPELTDTLLSSPNAPHFVPGCGTLEINAVGDMAEVVHRVKLELERRKLWHCVKGVRCDGANLTIMLEYSGTNYESPWRGTGEPKALVEF